MFRIFSPTFINSRSIQKCVQFLEISQRNSNEAKHCWRMWTRVCIGNWEVESRKKQLRVAKNVYTFLNRSWVWILLQKDFNKLWYGTGTAEGQQTWRASSNRRSFKEEGCASIRTKNWGAPHPDPPSSDGPTVLSQFSNSTWRILYKYLSKLHLSLFINRLWLNLRYTQR